MPVYSEDLIGCQIGGYKLKQIIGKGGTSTVFLGVNPTASIERAAIKVLMPPPQLSSTELQEVRRRFAREALMLSQHLRHPHILPVLASGYDQQTGFAYTIMPYIQGGTLAKRIANGGMSVEQILKYITQISLALDYAHDQNVIHRDLKPANILVDEQEHVYLADFGIGKLFDQNFSTLTEIGRVIGTPEYMAPEQARGEEVGKAADLYALAVITYVLILGQLPYTPGPMVNMLVQVIARPPIAPRALRMDFPLPAEAVLLCALSKDPTARFPSARAFVQAFDEAIHNRWPQGFPVQSSTLEVVTEVVTGSYSVTPVVNGPINSKRKRRQKPFFLLGTCLLVVLLTIGLVFATRVLPQAGGLKATSSVGSNAQTRLQGQTQTSSSAKSEVTIVTTSTPQATATPGKTIPQISSTRVPSPTATLQPVGRVTVTISASPPPNPGTDKNNPTPPPFQDAHVTLKPATMNFTGCGQTVTFGLSLTNDGQTAVSWDAYLSGKDYSFKPINGDILPGHEQELFVAGQSATTNLIFHWISTSGQERNIYLPLSCS